MQQQAAEEVDQPKREGQPVLPVLEVLVEYLMVGTLRAVLAALLQLHYSRWVGAEALGAAQLARAEMATTLCATRRAVVLALGLRLEGL